MTPVSTATSVPADNRLGHLLFALGLSSDARHRPAGMTPTPAATIFRDNGAQLLRFGTAAGVFNSGSPVLVVPSMINRWYVLDLRKGASVIAHLVNAGLDVYCVDWGDCRDEDRYLTWDDVLTRLGRMVRATLRCSGSAQAGMLGYCMGATLASIYTALHPHQVAALVNLAGPIDFGQAGALAHMTRPHWFDVDAIASAGNVAPDQMQSGFTAMRPTLSIGKWVGLADRLDDALSVEAFAAMESWASDNVAFPAAAYRTYIADLYQRNLLVAGQHTALGRQVDLGHITCPTLVVTAARDTICPPPAALALLAHVSATEKRALQVPGGHVGAVIGGRASRELYPAMASWFGQHAV